VSTEGLIPDFPVLAYSEGYTGLTVRGSHTITRATAANVVALGRPCRQFGGMMAQEPGTFVFGYTRTHASIKQLRIAWAYRSDPDPAAGFATISVSLTIRDALGNAITPPASEIPTALDGTTYGALSGSLSPTGDVHLGGVGYLDLDAIAATLVDPSWSFEFTFARSATDVTLEWIDAWECPRTSVSDADTYGALTGPLNPGNPISAGSVTTRGYERIAKTIEGGIKANRTHLSVAWPRDIATAPSTVSAAYAPFSTLLESAGTPLPWRFRPRVVYLPSSAVGEPARVRYLYYVAGGGNAAIRLNTGSSSDPFDATGLSGASWQWSPWVDCYLPTNGTDRIVSATFEGKTTAGALYLAGIELEENQ